MSDVFLPGGGRLGVQKSCLPISSGLIEKAAASLRDFPLIFQRHLLQGLCRNWHHDRLASNLAQRDAVAEASQGRSLRLSG